MPLVGWVMVVMRSVSPVSGAISSLASASMALFVESSATVMGSATARGSSLTGVTVIAT
jgi:hypothetical protein